MGVWLGSPLREGAAEPQTPPLFGGQAGKEGTCSGQETGRWAEREKGERVQHFWNGFMASVISALFVLISDLPLNTVEHIKRFTCIISANPHGRSTRYPYFIDKEMKA